MKPALASRPQKGLRRGLDTSFALTPIIDVIFLLQIFFICTAHWEDVERRLATEIQNTSAAGSNADNQDQLSDLEPIMIEIVDEENKQTFRLNGEKIDDFSTLEKRLIALGQRVPELPVTIKTSPKTAFATFVQLHDACSVARFESITLAHQASSNTNSSDPGTNP